MEKRGKIFLFAGRETFLLREKVQNWQKASAEKYGADAVEVFNAENWKTADWKNAKNAAATAPFFTAARVLFFQNLSTAAAESENWKIFADLPKNLPAENTVIFAAENPDARTKSWKIAQSLADEKIIFDPIPPAEIPRWVAARFAGFGKKISPAIARNLVDFCGTNLQKLAAEIAKLANFPGEISPEIIREIAVPQPETEAFAFANAFQNGNLSRILSALDAEIAAGIDPHGTIFRLILPTLRNLTKVADAENADAAGVHPFVFSKFKSLAQRFSREKIGKMFADLNSIDVASKTGKIKMTPAQETVLLELEKFFWKNFAR
jgi:DNA polymerase III delta subunit